MDINHFVNVWDSEVHINFLSLMSRLAASDPQLASECLCKPHGKPYQVEIDGGIYEINNPKYINVSQRIEELKNVLLRRDNKPYLSDSFHSVLCELHALEYYQTLFKAFTSKDNPLKANDLYEEHTILYDKLKKMSRLLDPSTFAKTCLVYLEQRNILTSDQQKRHVRTIEGNVIIETLPSISLLRSAPSNEKRSKAKKKVSITEEPDKIIQERVSPVVKKTSSKKASPSKKTSAAAIKKILESSPFGKFPFETEEECGTNKTSQKYYLSKEDILKVIETLEAKHKEKLPKNYKTMSKAKLCDVLFKTSKI